ncbi:MAG: hypothetical protein WA828_05385 [Coleofasciculaceae cyanobacterium]
MIAFEIQLNGEPLCTAGVDKTGVLTVIATCIRRTPSDSISGELIEIEPEAELSLNVGGRTHSDGSNVNLRWIECVLQVGDEICIKVARTSQVDEPLRSERENPNFVELEEQRYYEQLKHKYGD